MDGSLDVRFKKRCALSRDGMEDGRKRRELERERHLFRDGLFSATTAPGKKSLEMTLSGGRDETRAGAPSTEAIAST